MPADRYTHRIVTVGQSGEWCPMSEQYEQIGDADIASLKEKLREFCESLTPAEYAALAAVVQRAASTLEDTAGFGDIKLNIPTPLPPPPPVYKLPEIVGFVALNVLGSPIPPATAG
jgi:hypothetical protein